jgi:hypothetical protein
MTSSLSAYDPRTLPSIPIREKDKARALERRGLRETFTRSELWFSREPENENKYKLLF